MSKAQAPGKIILFGEHAVVYGRPAIAVPVTDVRTQVVVEVGPAGSGVTIAARDLGLVHHGIDSGPPGTLAYPLATTVRNVLQHLAVFSAPDLSVTISSTIPISRGMGSGAAVATAIVRALAAHLGRDLSNGTVSDLVYQTEVIYHGTPSGIDNSVIVFETPIYFVKGCSPQPFSVGKPLRLVVADTGVIVSTREVVEDVRRAWTNDRARYEDLFDHVGQLASRARDDIEVGQHAHLGALMNENQCLLQSMGVSSPELETLIHSARNAGAQGAKLSGAGRGGNMIALVRDASEEMVSAALREAGAVSVIRTTVT